MCLNGYVSSKNKTQKEIAQGLAFLGVLGCEEENQEKIKNSTKGSQKTTMNSQKSHKTKSCTVKKE